MGQNAYSNTPRLVLGFHGCEENVAQKVLRLQDCLKPSANDYDWLGHGVYFWENDPLRALEWAEKRSKGHPSVIGAVIDLGNCLSILERDAIRSLQEAYISLVNVTKEFGIEMPQNTNAVDGYEMKRKLDCAVFEKLHDMTKKTNQPPYDTVVGAGGVK